MKIIMIIMAAAACLVAVLLYYRRGKLNSRMENDERSVNGRLMGEIRGSGFDEEAYRRHEEIKISRIYEIYKEESIAETVIRHMRERTEKAGVTLEVRDKEKIISFFDGFDNKKVIGFLYNMLENALEGAEAYRKACGYAPACERVLSGVDAHTTGEPDILLYCDDNGWLVCSNKYDNKKLISSEVGYKTSKMDGSHGYGLYAMKRVADEYGMTFKVLPEKDIFVVRAGR